MREDDISSDPKVRPPISAKGGFPLSAEEAMWKLQAKLCEASQCSCPITGSGAPALRFITDLVDDPVRVFRGRTTLGGLALKYF